MKSNRLGKRRLLLLQKKVFLAVERKIAVIGKISL